MKKFISIFIDRTANFYLYYFVKSWVIYKKGLLQIFRKSHHLEDIEN